jgi:hypothetical protein
MSIITEVSETIPSALYFEYEPDDYLYSSLSLISFKAGPKHVSRTFDALRQSELIAITDRGYHCLNSV